MPIKLQSTDIARIYSGEDEYTPMRRVYRGTELIYGLYDVHYYDRYYVDEYKPKRYAWGYAPECVPFPLPNDAPDYFEEYLTHWGNSGGAHGWYESNTFNSSKQFDRIFMTDHRDLHEYARWRQHRYTYEGTVKYDVYEWIPPQEGAPSPSDDAYPWGGSAAWAMPNCTWYAKYRVQQLGYPDPISGMPDAGWRWTTVLQNGWKFYMGLKNWRAGDILLWSGHVAVADSNSTISGSYWTDGGPNFTLDRSGTAEDLYEQVVENWDEPAYSQSGGSGGTLGWRYWHESGSIGEEYDESKYLGYIRYEGSSSSSGGSGTRSLLTAAVRGWSVNSPPGFSGVQYGGTWSKYFWDEDTNGFAHAGNYMANCTTYCFGRALMAGFSAPVSGGNAGQWLSKCSSSWTAVWNSDWDSVKASLQPGDIVVSSNHVSFVENNGNMTASWWTNDGHRGDPQTASDYYSQNYPSRFYRDVDWDTEYKQGHHSSILGYMRSKTNPTPPEPGPGPGPIPPGPGGTWEYAYTESIDFDEQDVIDQQNPSVPDASEFAPPVSDQYRNPRWEPLITNTYERQIHYPVRESGYWEEDWRKISSSGFVMSWGD